MKTFVKYDVDWALPQQWENFAVVAYLSHGNRSACVLIHDARDKTWHSRTGWRWGFLNILGFTSNMQIYELMDSVSFQGRTPEEAIDKAITQGRVVLGFNSYFEYIQWLASVIST